MNKPAEQQTRTIRQKTENYLFSWWHFFVLITSGFITGLLITPQIIPAESMQPNLNIGIAIITTLVFCMAHIILICTLLDLQNRRIKKLIKEHNTVKPKQSA